MNALLIWLPLDAHNLEGQERVELRQMEAYQVKISHNQPVGSDSKQASIRLLFSGNQSPLLSFGEFG